MALLVSYCSNEDWAGYPNHVLRGLAAVRAVAQQAWQGAFLHLLCGSYSLLQPLECASAVTEPTKPLDHQQVEVLHLQQAIIDQVT